jgi:F-type H+-transporting ATPase subunit b
MGRLAAPLSRCLRALAVCAAFGVSVPLLGLVAAAASAQEAHAPPTGHAAEPAAPAAVGEESPIEHGIEKAEHGGGLPQLDVLTYPSQIFWLILSFAALYYLMTRKALPRLSEILEARQERIASDLDRAARLRAEAESALERHQQVVAAAQAKAAAEMKEVEDRLTAEAARRQAELDADLAKRLADAEARINASKNAALSEIQGVAVEVARSAVQRLAGLKVPERDVKAALDKVLAEAA